MSSNIISITRNRSRDGSCVTHTTWSKDLAVLGACVASCHLTSWLTIYSCGLSLSTEIMRTFESLFTPIETGQSRKARNLSEPHIREVVFLREAEKPNCTMLF